MNAKHPYLLLCLAGCCFVVAGGLLGCSSGLNPLNWFNDAITTPAPGGPQPERYSLAALLWTWARILIGLGLLGAVASIFAPVIPTRACASVAVVGGLCAIAAKFLDKYEWVLELALVIGGVIVLWPAFEAARRWIEAKATGQPVKGHTGKEALKQLIPFARKGKPNGHQGSADSRARVGAAVLPAHQARAVAPDPEPERGGGGAS